MSAVLLLAYKRWQNMDVILDVCRSAGVNPIYIHVDADSNPGENLDVSRTLEKVSTYKRRWGIDIRIASQGQNAGCATSMILSINRVFQTEDRIIVLEDDCLPTLGFFQFMEESFREMQENTEIGLSCGAQFAPPSITHNKWFLSRYPLNWGWGITKHQWILLSSGILNSDKLKSRFNKVGIRESVYWNAGARRALNGYTDVWDTLLVREMIRHNLYCILPGVNLVHNVGNDIHALHTHGDQPWTNYPTGEFTSSDSAPIFNPQFDKWARLQFYRISFRHLFSTKITLIRDHLVAKPVRRPLRDRIQLAAVNFNK